MDESHKIFPSYAQSLDRVVDQIWPLKFSASKKSDPLRFKVAYILQVQIFEVAMSIVRLTKIAGEVNARAIDENSQIIMSATRVLTESCNKYYYLVIAPKDEEEFERRFAYYTLVGARNFRNLVRNTLAEASVIQNAEKIYENRKVIFSKTNPEGWPPFASLDQEAKGLVLKGRTAVDYLESDFTAAIGNRLNQVEKLHYQGLGNVATHSSSVLLFFQPRDEDENISVRTQLASFAIFNASRHLALLALEMIEMFQELGGKIGEKSLEELKSMARDVKHPSYLYV